MEIVEKYFSNDALAAHLGIELVEWSPGKARAKMTIIPEHLNGMGIVHGGAIFSLADFVFAVASNSHGTVALAINTSMSFVKAIKEGTLFADAWEESKNPKLATYMARVTDESGDIVAIFQGLAYRKKESIADYV